MNISVGGKKYTDCEQGTAGILAVLTMALLLIVGGGMLAVSSTEIQTAAAYRDGITAQYAAEAGAKRGLVELNADNSWAGIATATAIGNGSYKVAVSGTGGSRTITSTGTVNKATRQVLVTVSLGSAGSALYNTDIYSVGAMTINSGSDIKGDVGSASSVTNWGGTIEGNVGACSSYTGNGTVTGTITQTPKSNTIPSIPVSFTNTGSHTGYTSLSNQINGGSQFLSGNYYVNGNFELNNSAVINIPNGSSATIYVDGYVHLNWGTVINGNVTIISTTGNVELNGGSIKAASGGSVQIYAYNSGYVHLNSGSSIQAANMMIVSDGNIEFNGGVVNLEGSGTAKIYSNNYVKVNSGSAINSTTNGQGNGIALIMANGNMELNGGVCSKTVLIASGPGAKIQSNWGSKSGPLYANGTMEIDGGTVYYDQTVLQNLGLSASSSISIVSWNNH